MRMPIFDQSTTLTVNTFLAFVGMQAQQGFAVFLRMIEKWRVSCPNNLPSASFIEEEFTPFILRVTLRPLLYRVLRIF